MTTRLLPIVLLCACKAAGSDGGGGTLTATWKLENPDGSAASCQPGYDQMQITTLGFFPDGADIADPQTAMFDCAAGTATVELTGDFTKYTVKWDETDSTGDTVFMTDQISGTELMPTVVDVSSGAATAGITMYPTGGWAWLEWGLFGTTVQDFVDSCEGAGVDMIEIVLTDTTSNAMQTFMATCDAVPASLTLDTSHGVGAINVPVAAGDYTIAATAFAAGQMVGTGAGDISIFAPNKIDFTPSVLDIDLTTR